MKTTEKMLPQLKAAIQRWSFVGLFAYFSGFLFLASSKHKAFFYLFIVLPGLFLFPHLKTLYRQHPAALASIGLFLGYFSASALWGDGSIADAIKYSVFIICLMLIIEASTRQIRPLSVIKIVTTIGGFAAVIYCLIFAFSDTSFDSLAVQRFTFYAFGGLGNNNPNHCALVLGLPVIAAWWLFPTEKWLWRVMLAILMLASLALIFFTGSRGAILALGVALTVLVTFRRSKEDLVLFFIGILLVCIALGSNDFRDFTIQRIETPSYRQQILAEALTQIKNHWLIGDGFGHNAKIYVTPDVSVSHSHATIIEAFRLGGIIGGALLFSMLFFMLRPAFCGTRLFFMVWIVYGGFCLTTSGQSLLIKPTAREFAAFWIPFFLNYFYSHQKWWLDEEVMPKDKYRKET
jgi:hypothetical protein